MSEHTTAQFWDEMYGSTTRVWSGNPNPLLTREVSDLAPGSALDAGCGEGADSHWLARRGWRVHGVDISSVALERAAAQTEPEIAGRITWERGDLTEWVPRRRAYDLVNSQFLHFPRALREPLFARLADAVAPGGTLLLVGHHPSDLHTTVRRPQEPDLFFTPEELVANLAADDWEVLVAQASPREVADGHGHGATIRDTVVRARRRS
ncbi:MAG TPA: class I SAM-dependent methyltransferase [Pseudonocardia sp.]|jgi:SAM-dependent methyltransferase|nr:class I SAM-dependent methyltransferase [Pseudonocardia sp.]